MENVRITTVLQGGGGRGSQARNLTLTNISNHRNYSYVISAYLCVTLDGQMVVMGYLWMLLGG